MGPKTSLGVKNLFNPTPPTTKTNKQEKEYTGNQTEPLISYKRQTYHLRLEQIKKIKEYAFFNELDRSEVVRQALDSFFSKWKSPIPTKKYKV